MSSLKRSSSRRDLQSPLQSFDIKCIEKAVGPVQERVRQIEDRFNELMWAYYGDIFTDCRWLDPSYVRECSRGPMIRRGFFYAVAKANAANGEKSGVEKGSAAKAGSPSSPAPDDKTKAAIADMSRAVQGLAAMGGSSSPPAPPGKAVPSRRDCLDYSRFAGVAASESEQDSESEFSDPETAALLHALRSSRGGGGRASQ